MMLRRGIIAQSKFINLILVLKDFLRCEASSPAEAMLSLARARSTLLLSSCKSDSISRDDRWLCTFDRGGLNPSSSGGVIGGKLT